MGAAEGVAVRYRPSKSLEPVGDWAALLAPTGVGVAMAPAMDVLSLCPTMRWSTVTAAKVAPVKE